MTLKELRISFNITQNEASLCVGVPLRTYKRYEQLNDESNLKYIKMKELLIEKYEITEEKGLLTFEKIKDIVNDVLIKYNDEISFCYLFGSYAKGYAKESSDVDLLIDTSLSGLKFVGLIEKLHQNLKKNVDVLRFKDLSDNMVLINEIMKEGIKIYG
jgi:predicted nucleotidyltransferase